MIEKLSFGFDFLKNAETINNIINLHLPLNNTEI